MDFGRCESELETCASEGVCRGVDSVFLLVGWWAGKRQSRDQQLRGELIYSPIMVSDNRAFVKQKAKGWRK